MWTRRERCALIAMVDLAVHGGAKPVQARAIAERQKLPLPFLEQVIHALRQAGLVTGRRGPGGGFRLAEAASVIRAGDIVRAARSPKARAPAGEARPLRASALAMLCDATLAAAEAASARYLDGLTLDELRRRGSLDADFVI